MIIRTSEARQPAFTLKKDVMIERDPKPYMLLRSDLKLALELHSWYVPYFWINLFGVKYGPVHGHISEGKTERGEKFIQIGCKRFVGVNRLKLILWAKSGK
jgi:hypothetical protein